MDIYIYICIYILFRVLGSKKGFQLSCLADTHIGSDVTLLLSHRMLADPFTMIISSQQQPRVPRPLPAFGARLQKSLSHKSSLLLGT